MTSGGSADARSWLGTLRWLGVDLRPGETRLVGGLFLASFVLGVFQFSSKAVRQAGFINDFGADRLPFVYLAVALTAYPVLRIYGSVADRWSPLAVISSTAGIIVAGLVFFWWFMATPASWVSVAYYVWVAIATALALTQLWSLASAYLHARQARRLFGFIGAGSLLGGVVGGQVAALSAEEPRNALLVAAAMLLLMIYIVYRLHAAERRGMTLTGEVLRPEVEPGSLDPAPEGEPLSQRPRGLEVLASSPHLRLIAGILMITVVVAQIIDLQFSWVIENTRESYADRVSAFGNVFSLMGLSAFLFQLVLTPRIHRSFGVGHAMRVLPTFVVVGCALLLFASNFAPTLLVMAVGLLRVGDNGLRYSLDHVTRELLFVPVPAAQRVEAKGYVDVFVHRFGKAIGALLLLVVTFGFVSVLDMTWVTLALVVVWLWLTVRAKAHYLNALRTGLSDGEGWDVRENAEDLALDPNDVNTLELLIESLGSPDPARVVSSLELLRTHGRANLVPPLLLYHDDASVRRLTLEVLQEDGRRDALPLIERCVGDPDADVRAVAIQALASLSSRRGPELMSTRLDDPDPRVRAAAIQCVATQGSEEQRVEAHAALVDLLTDGDAQVRVEAASVLGVLPDEDLQKHVIALLFDADKQVVRSMIIALRHRMAAGDRSPIYAPILISLLRDRRLKHDARQTLVACGREVLPALSHFLNDTNEQIWVRRAIPKTLVHFAGRGASAVLYECLATCQDPMQRSKVIEALAAMAEHQRDVERLKQSLHDAAHRYFECLVALDSLTEGRMTLEGTSVTLPLVSGDRRKVAQPLVLRLLDEHRRTVLEDLAGLIGLLVPGVDFGALFELDVSGEQRKRLSSQAVEYLDNVLDGRLRDEVLLVLDELPQARRLESAINHFELERRAPQATLGWLLSRASGHEVERWLAAAAAFRIGELRARELYPEVERLAREGESDLVKETAQHVLERMIA